MPCICWGLALLVVKKISWLDKFNHEKKISEKISKLIFLLIKNGRAIYFNYLG